MITGYASKDSAVEAVRLGVYDYLEKPFDTLELLTSIVNGLEHIELKRKNDALIKALQTHQEGLEQKVQEKTSEVLERERKLARIESLRQVLATLAHYINNANGVILAHADMCQQTPDRPKTARLIQACLQEGQKITAVIDSLRDVVEKMAVKSVLYVQGSDQMMIDIEAEIERRLLVTDNL